MSYDNWKTTEADPNEWDTRESEPLIDEPVGALIDEFMANLDYLSYREQRRLSPHIAPGRWSAIYGDAVAEMEKRYLNEKE